MSLWRVKHTLSPVIEYALIGLVAAYGLFGIYAASLRPLATASVLPVRSVPEPVTLDQERWTRHDARAEGFAFAAPPGWLVDVSDLGDIRLGRSVKELERAGRSGGGIMLQPAALTAATGIAELAAADLAGSRPALYDVAVDGALSLFAVAFERGRVARQAAYVPYGERALVVRSAAADPAVFAAFLSTIKFYSPETLTPDL